MAWWSGHKNEIIVGTLVALLAAGILAAVANFSEMSNALLLGLIHFRHYAYRVPGGGWARVFFVLGGLLVWGVWPTVGSVALVFWALDPQPRSRLYRNDEYEMALAAFLASANALEGKKRIPHDVSRQLVELLRLFERGTADILGRRHRRAFRMLWWVRLPGAENDRFKVWAFPPPNET